MPSAAFIRLSTCSPPTLPCSTALRSRRGPRPPHDPGARVAGSGGIWQPTPQRAACASPWATPMPPRPRPAPRSPPEPSAPRTPSTPCARSIIASRASWALCSPPIPFCRADLRRHPQHAGDGEDLVALQGAGARHPRHRRDERRRHARRRISAGRLHRAGSQRQERRLAMCWPAACSRWTGRLTNFLSLHWRNARSGPSPAHRQPRRHDRSWRSCRNARRRPTRQSRGRGRGQESWWPRS